MPSYELAECGCTYDTVDAETIDEALAIALTRVNAAIYASDATAWVDIRVRCAETGEAARRWITVDPREPVCAGGGAHDWYLALEHVGGLERSPDVQAGDGGPLIRERCRHCGHIRVTDTYAHRPEDDTRGHRSVSYEIS